MLVSRSAHGVLSAGSSVSSNETALIVRVNSNPLFASICRTGVPGGVASKSHGSPQLRVDVYVLCCLPNRGSKSHL
jgi:hypothetical protein